MCRLLSFNDPRESGMSKHDLNMRAITVCLSCSQCVSMQPVHDRSLVMCESFSPILCNSLLCCVCWPCNSRIWDLTDSRSLWLSRSVSCKERKQNKYTWSVYDSIQLQKLFNFSGHTVFYSFLGKQPATANSASPVLWSKPERKHWLYDHLPEVSWWSQQSFDGGWGQMLQPWWATCLASWKSKDLFYFPLYMSEKAPRANV